MEKFSQLLLCVTLVKFLTFLANEKIDQIKYSCTAEVLNYSCFP